MPENWSGSTPLEFSSCGHRFSISRAFSKFRWALTRHFCSSRPHLVLFSVISGAPLPTAMSHAADYPGAVIAACCGPTLHLWRPQQPGNAAHYVDTPAACDRAVLAAAWNRNNKVVGAAREDGVIELRYSNGDLMSVLPRTGPPPSARPLTSLSWSLGSKRLAAGSADGNVYVHDMTAKVRPTPCSDTLPWLPPWEMSPASLPGLPLAHCFNPPAAPLLLQSCTMLAAGGSRVSAVAFHAEDKFLAAAGAEVTLFSPQLTHVGHLSTADRSERTCLSLSAGPAMTLAAGSARGGLAVWDCKSQILLHEDAQRHVAGTSAVAFVPLEASLLYSAGTDGTVLLHDLRAGPLQGTPALLRLRVGAGVSCLAVREDHAMLAAGTTDGTVALYDPRAAAAPMHRLRCAGGGRVTGLHWQHNYQSIGSRARAAASAASAPPLGAADAAALARRASTAAYAPAPFTDAMARPSFGEGSPVDGLAAGARPPHGDGGPSLLPDLAPPLKLDLTPMPVGAMGGPLGGASFSPLAEVNLNDRWRAAAAASRPGAAGPTDPAPSAAVAGTKVPAAQRPVQPAAGLPRRPSTAAAPPQVQPNETERPRPPAVPALDIAAASSSGSPAGGWSIKAVTPRRPGSGQWAEQAAAEGSHAARDAPPSHHQRSYQDFRGSSAKHGGSPSKVALGPGTSAAAGGLSQAHALVQDPPGHGLREDILALHLDLLTQFQEQQAATAALVAGVVERQEALAAELAHMRRQLGELLSKRDDVLWL